MARRVEDLALVLNLYEIGLRLEVTLVMDWNAEGVLDDQVRLAKSFFDVALTPL